MATSESDGDFESADEELGRGISSRRDTQTTYWTSPTTVDSESDDDTEYIQHMPCRSSNSQKKNEIWITSLPDIPMSSMTAVSDKSNKTDSDVKVESNVHTGKSTYTEKTVNNSEDTSILVKATKSSISTSTVEKNVNPTEVESSKIVKSKDTMSSKAEATKSEGVSRTSRRNPSYQLNAKKLGTKIAKCNINKCLVTDNVTTEKEENLIKHSNEESLNSEKDVECRLQKRSENQPTNNQPQSMDNLQEIDMPEELRSNKKFKEVFQPEGWESLGNDIELPDELTEEKLQPILERLTLVNKESENSLDSWGNWGNWGVSSLINTATAGVSTLTNHVSQGLTLFEGTTEVAESSDITRTKQDAIPSGTISPIFLNKKMFNLIFCTNNFNYTYETFFYSLFPAILK